MKTILVVTIMLVASMSTMKGQNASTEKQLSVANLNIMVREGREMPDGTKEGNNASITFELNNALLADRVKVVVKQISTQEILDVRTIQFSEKDGIAFYTNNGRQERMKRNIVNIEVNIGTMAQGDIEVEVYGIDKKNKMTAKVKR